MDIDNCNFPFPELIFYSLDFRMDSKIHIKFRKVPVGETNPWFIEHIAYHVHILVPDAEGYIMALFPIWVEIMALPVILKEIFIRMLLDVSNRPGNNFC
jgi:hypothetical protein